MGLFTLHRSSAVRERMPWYATPRTSLPRFAIVSSSALSYNNTTSPFFVIILLPESNNLFHWYSISLHETYRYTFITHIMSTATSAYLVESANSSDHNAVMVLQYPMLDHVASPAFQKPSQSPPSSSLDKVTYNPPVRPRAYQPQLIATISAGFAKGDYLVREEKGSNIYFDFFEEAFNFACQKGYTHMNKHEEEDYMEVIKRAHKSVPGGCRFNTGRLLMVLRKKLVPLKVSEDEYDEEPLGTIMEGRSLSRENRENSKRKSRGKLAQSTNTMPTDSESSGSVRSGDYSVGDEQSYVASSAYSSASTSYVDSWEWICWNLSGREELRMTGQSWFRRDRAAD